MDQKHAMLYPSIEHGANGMPHDQRISASAAIGLPTEAPPSYDMAMSTEPTASSSRTGTSMGWLPSAPIPTTPEIVLHTQTQPQPHPHMQPFSRNEIATRSVIVLQPTPVQQQNLPTETTPLPPKLGPNPCAVTCPACGASKTTRMSYTPNSRTHLCALLLCLVGWCCCACCVPYCMNSCRSGNHYCSKCNTFLGTFNPRTGK